jgi:3-deoxy-D-manno-octulosonate 8-phosphate phosphatase (KDO 8-P phosphatase)
MEFGNYSMIRKSLQDVKTIIMDIDGVLTDGHVYVTEGDWRIKSFNQRDTLGIMIAKHSEIKLAWVSLRLTEIAKKRAVNIGIDEVLGAKYGKLKAIEEYLMRNNLDFKDVAYIGDDIDDYRVMEQCGFPVAVNDATEEIKIIAKYIAKNNGGMGAVREVIELVLREQNKWNTSVNKFFAELANPLEDPTNILR